MTAFVVNVIILFLELFSQLVMIMHLGLGPFLQLNEGRL